MKFFLLYLLLINALGAALMLIDKKKAQRGAWRIPEKTLLTVAAMGGSIGSYLGMRLFRHKTKHPQFSIGLPVLIALQCCAVVFGYILLRRA